LKKIADNGRGRRHAKTAEGGTRQGSQEAKGGELRSGARRPMGGKKVKRKGEQIQHTVR